MCVCVGAIEPLFLLAPSLVPVFKRVARRNLIARMALEREREGACGSGEGRRWAVLTLTILLYPLQLDRGDPPERRLPGELSASAGAEPAALVA